MSCYFQPNIVLTEEQRKILNKLCNSSWNFLIIGKSGTGKTALLREFARISGKHPILTAMTGCAAVALGGTTVHSCFGLKPTEQFYDIDTAQKLVNKLRNRNKLKKANCIVIDEISLLRIDTINIIDVMLKIIKNNHLPFGGCQMILSGDPLLISPFGERNKSVQKNLEKNNPSLFFFNASCVKSACFQTLHLVSSLRHRDQTFVEILDEIRSGIVTSKATRWLNSRCGITKGARSEIVLTDTQDTADEINEFRLSELPGEPVLFSCKVISHDPRNYHEILKSTPMVKNLKLKPRAEVMFITNGDNWQNGTFGIVSLVSKDPEFVRVSIDGREYDVKKEKHPVYDTNSDPISQKSYSQIIGSVEQYPLMLAWAITSHKAQGLTFESADIEFKPNVEISDGQVYSALSRCSNPEKIYLSRSFRADEIHANKEAIRYICSVRYEKNPVCLNNCQILVTARKTKKLNKNHDDVGFHADVIRTIPMFYPNSFIPASTMELVEPYMFHCIKTNIFYDNLTLYASDAFRIIEHDCFRHYSRMPNNVFNNHAAVYHNGKVYLSTNQCFLECIPYIGDPYVVSYNGSTTFNGCDILLAPDLKKIKQYNSLENVYQFGYECNLIQCFIDVFNDIEGRALIIPSALRGFDIVDLLEYWLTTSDADMVQNPAEKFPRLFSHEELSHKSFFAKKLALIRQLKEIVGLSFNEDDFNNKKIIIDSRKTGSGFIQQYRQWVLSTSRYRNK